jgi:hypothetical protein
VQEKLAIDGLVLDDDEGWLEVSAGAERPVRLDVYKCYLTYHSIATEREGDHEALGEEWVAFLVTQGCPRLPHAAALQVASELAKLVPPDILSSFARRHANPRYGYLF